jgi:uncharacterized protein YjbJ (UPF0337 family)
VKVGQVDTERLRGVSDKIVGVGKELAGVLLGNDSLQESGERQQARATEELRSLRKQVEAERHEKQARIAEGKERAAQKAKSSSL